MRKYQKKNFKKIVKVLITILFLVQTTYAQTGIDSLEVRGFAIAAPKSKEVSSFVKFIKKDLSRTSVNTLFLRVNYNYEFKSHPELAEKNALSEKEVKKIVKICKKQDIRIVPIINLLGHQSWKQNNIRSLLRVYPQFEENPGEYLHSEDFYCRSYCPLHPEVHKVVFALVDELIEVFETTRIHVGMDEVFTLGQASCSRCKGKSKAGLFAGEISKINTHLKNKKVTMYMWGDRLIDGVTTGLGKWSASENGTHTAIDRIPKDIVICDWQYKSAPPTNAYFAIKGFQVISCSFQKPEIAIAQLESAINIRKRSKSPIRERMLGVMHTYWGSFDSFLKCYKEQNCQTDKIKGAITTFNKLYTN